MRKECRGTWSWQTNRVLFHKRDSPIILKTLLSAMPLSRIAVALCFTPMALVYASRPVLRNAIRAFDDNPSGGNWNDVILALASSCMWMYCCITSELQLLGPSSVFNIYCVAWNFNPFKTRLKGALCLQNLPILHEDKT